MRMYFCCCCCYWMFWWWFPIAPLFRPAELHQIPRGPDGHIGRRRVLCVPGRRRAQTQNHLDEEGQESQLAALWGEHPQLERNMSPGLRIAIDPQRKHTRRSFAPKQDQTSLPPLALIFSCLSLSRSLLHLCVSSRPHRSATSSPPMHRSWCDTYCRFFRHAWTKTKPHTAFPTICNRISRMRRGFFCLLGFLICLLNIH